MAHILLIEDDSQLRDMLALALGRAGYRVSCAENGCQGLAVLKQTPVDVIVADLYMPEMDGLEVLRAFRRECGQVPVIAISGGSRQIGVDYLKAARVLGAAVTLAKPFACDELVAAVDRVRSGPGARGGGRAEPVAQRGLLKVVAADGTGT